MIKNIYEKGYTQNREVSWLRFNDRVLNEAKDPSVPLLERLKFVSIFASNLMEFYMVRVGSLTEMKSLKPGMIDNKSGLTPKQQVELINKVTARSMQRKDEVFKDLRRKLRKVGIEDVSLNNCTRKEKKFLKKYFRERISPYVSPQIVDSHHPFPNLANGVVHAAAIVKYSGHGVFAFVAVPASCPSIITLPSEGDTLRFVHTEDVILDQLESIFGVKTITERLKIRIVRNADVNPDDDAFDDIVDYRKKIRKVLSERRTQFVVALTISEKCSGTMKQYLCRHLDLNNNQVFLTSAPMDLSYSFSLASLCLEKAEELLYTPYTPKLSPALDYKKNLFSQILKKDVLLSYPYESMEPFLQLVRESADDPDVVSIKITIYRLAKQARLVEYLCRAAENGKEVVTLIELKARFDEQNNIDYSQRLEEAGCTVLYGFEDYKVHSKICMITRSHKGKAESVLQVATGNFNEKTAKQYTDLAYFTARTSLVKDAKNFFQNMMLGKLDGTYRQLIVSPVSLKSTVLACMDKEIAKGPKGRIRIKINSITDEDIIARLSKASQAGVHITMTVRGICCILPGIPKKTEHLEIKSVVGRYLEHSRIYSFGEGEGQKLYISSADFMTRNTERRVEIAIPILDNDIKEKLNQYLDIYESDNTGARVLLSNGRYHKCKDVQTRVNAQEWMMKHTKASSQKIGSKEGKSQKMIAVFHTKYKRKK